MNPMDMGKKAPEIKVQEVKIPEVKKPAIIVILNENIKIETTSDNVVNVEPTSDGIVILFKDHSQYNVTAPNMNATTKNTIKMLMNTVKGKKVTLNLMNYRQPVSIEN